MCFLTTGGGSREFAAVLFLSLGDEMDKGIRTHVSELLSGLRRALDCRLRACEFYCLSGEACLRGEERS